MRPAQPGALPGPAEHPAGSHRRPRLPGACPVQLDQQHPVTGLAARILGGHVAEVGVHHRRADPLDQPAGHRPALQPPRQLGLGLSAVRITGPVTDVDVRGAALPARRPVPQMQIRQVAGFALRVEPSLLPEEFADAARNLDATTDARFARIGLTPDVIALIRRRLATWPRDPSQLPGATGNQPRPHAGLRSERYASRPQRYPSGGG